MNLVAVLLAAAVAATAHATLLDADVVEVGGAHVRGSLWAKPRCCIESSGLPKPPNGPQ